MKINLTKEDKKVVQKIAKQVENNSKQLDEIVDEIIKPYCDDLDMYVQFVYDIVDDADNPPTDSELEDFCLNLSANIYFASGLVEQLGIRDDISKAVYKEMYNSSRAEVDKGTIDDKNSIAELQSQHEQIVNICYNRAYKIMKAKVDSAQELLSSCKKALSRRMQEIELTKMMGGKS